MMRHGDAAESQGRCTSMLAKPSQQVSKPCRQGVEGQVRLRDQSEALRRSYQRLELVLSAGHARGAGLHVTVHVASREDSAVHADVAAEAKVEVPAEVVSSGHVDLERHPDVEADIGARATLWAPWHGVSIGGHGSGGDGSTHLADVAVAQRLRGLEGAV